jgi:hypothetical protein
MRKFMVAGILAALGVAMLAIPASASFDHHFRVFEKGTFKQLENGNGFRFRGKLFQVGNRDNRVGRDHGVTHFSHDHPAGRVRGTVHLNGEVGGFGDIKYRGNIRRHDTRLNVVGGSGDFNGVAGKIVYRNLNRSGSKTVDKFDLVR